MWERELKRNSGEAPEPPVVFYTYTSVALFKIYYSILKRETRPFTVGQFFSNRAKSKDKS